jgi:hypothetical protein
MVVLPDPDAGAAKKRAGQLTVCGVFLDDDGVFLDDELDGDVDIVLDHLA